MNREKKLFELSEIAQELNKIEYAERTLNKNYSEKGIEIWINYRDQYIKERFEIPMPLDAYKAFIEVRKKEIKEKLDKAYNALNEDF